MEYRSEKIDEFIKNKISNSAAFKSKYKEIIMNNDNQHLKKSVADHIYAKDNNLINEYYKSENEYNYNNYSFINSENEGFTDNVENVKEGLRIGFDIPGLPGTPEWNWYHCTPPTLGSCPTSWWHSDRACINWHHSSGGRCHKWRGCEPINWHNDSDCGPEWWRTDYGTTPCWYNVCTSGKVPAVKGIPGTSIGFDVPSIEDMYKEMKNKIDSEVIEPFTGYKNDIIETIHETLSSFFEDNTKEILAIIVFCLIWLITTTVTETRTIVALVSLFIASLFYICIRDLNGILYTLEKPNNVISEALK